MKIVFRLLLGACLLVALSGCGQKGSLYITDEPERAAKERLEGYYKRY